MKSIARANNRRLGMVALLATLIVVGSISAYAVPKTQVLRVSDGAVHRGICCSSWNDSVRFVEPNFVVPVVVTWSAEYQSASPFLVGLSLNDGPCTFYGPKSIPAFTPGDSTMAPITFQWVIMPGDYKLIPGRNVVRLCGGGVSSETDAITLGFGTLAVRFGK